MGKRLNLEQLACRQRNATATHCLQMPSSSSFHTHDRRISEVLKILLRLLRVWVWVWVWVLRARRC